MDLFFLEESQKLQEYFEIMYYSAWGWFDEKGKILLPSEEQKADFSIPYTHSTMLKPKEVASKLNIRSSGQKLLQYYEFKPEFYRKGYIRWMVEEGSEDTIFWTFSPFYVTERQLKTAMDQYEWALINGDIEKIFGKELPIPSYISVGFVDFAKKGVGGRPFKREDSTPLGIDLIVEWNNSTKLWNIVQKRLELHQSGKAPLGN